MSAILLATKLHRPAPPPRLVGRPHLVQRLNDGLQSGCQLTLISAPAGFGKSTCASEWLAGQPWPVSWLALDPADDDPARFLAYFIAALQKTDAAIGRDAEVVLRSGQLPPLDNLVAALLNDVQNAGRKFFLVLDDFQVIKEGSILKAVELLLANQPENLHLVLITREDPQLPLARLRANHQMTEIRAGDLRFTRGEAGRFLNELMELRLSEADVARLEERTEGWVVGIQLAGLSMRGREDRSDFIAHLSGSHRYILSYLTEEVLRRQPEDTQAFLLQTSILGKLNGSLCDAVTGRPPGEGQALLEGLFSANLFLIPLDDDGQWFRYHHLFADLLQARLRQAFPPEAQAGLHVRAAAWFEAQGFAEEAIDHALAALDFDAAARLIERQSPWTMARGELVTLLRWIEILPAEFARLHPLILIAKAWTLTLAGAVRQVEPLLREAEAQLEPGAETAAARELRGNAAAIRAFFAMLAGEYPHALAQAELAEALLPETSVNARALLPYTQGASYRAQNQYDKALEAFGRVVRMGETYDDFITWATGITEIGNTCRYLGRLGEAEETCRRALQRMKERGVERFGSLAKVEVPLIEVLRERNQLEEADQRAADVIARMQGWSMPTDHIFAVLALIHIQQAQGDLAGAAESLGTAQELKATYPVLAALAGAVELSEIRLRLECGDTAAAARLAEDLVSRTGAGRIYSLHAQAQAMQARVRLAEGRAAEAASILSGLAGDPAAAERKGDLIEIMVLQARALEALGERDAAIERLLEALALAEPEGYVRVFADEGPGLRPLLSAAAAAAGPAALKAYATALLEAFPASAKPGEATPLPASAASLVEPLTERELEVLRLIAEGLKYEEIAGRLFISLNTVRTYVKAIYGKLEVNNRTQAIEIARKMKLI